MVVSETAVGVTTGKRQGESQSKEHLQVDWIFAMSRRIYNKQPTHCFPFATKEGVISWGKANWLDMDVEMTRV